MGLLSEEEKHEIMERRGFKSDKTGKKQPPSNLEIHHRNRDNKDNRPENLEKLTAKEHYKKHVVPILEARREAQISERLIPILEDQAIKFIFLGFAFFGALMFIAGLIINRKVDMWYIGLLFLIMGLVGWFIQRRKE